MLSIHRHVLKDAWNTIVKTWYLWPLGLFASLLGNGSEFQMLTNQYQLVNNQEGLVASLKATLLTPTDGLIRAFQNWTGVQTFIAFILLLVILALVWLSISSIAGLIIGINKSVNHEESSFGALLQAGTKKFWSTLGYIAIAKGITGFVIAIIFAPVIAASYQAGYFFFNSVLVIISILLIIPISIIINFITKFAIASHVINDIDFASAWRHAWSLFKNHWIIVIEQALILFAINLIVGMLLIVSFFLIFGPFFLLGSVTAGGFFPMIMLGVLLVGAVIVALGSGLAAFQYSAWTILYLRLNDDPSYISKLVRAIAALPDLFSRLNSKKSKTKE